MFKVMSNFIPGAISNTENIWDKVEGEGCLSGGKMSGSEQPFLRYGLTIKNNKTNHKYNIFLSACKRATHLNKHHFILDPESEHFILFLAHTFVFIILKSQVSAQIALLIYKTITRTFTQVLTVKSVN